MRKLKWFQLLITVCFSIFVISGMIAAAEEEDTQAASVINYDLDLTDRPRSVREVDFRSDDTLIIDFHYTPESDQTITVKSAKTSVNSKIDPMCRVYNETGKLIKMEVDTNGSMFDFTLDLTANKKYIFRVSLETDVKDTLILWFERSTEIIDLTTRNMMWETPPFMDWVFVNLNKAGEYEWFRYKNSSTCDVFIKTSENQNPVIQVYDEDDELVVPKSQFGQSEDRTFIYSFLKDKEYLIGTSDKNNYGSTSYELQIGWDSKDIGYNEDPIQTVQRYTVSITKPGEVVWFDDCIGHDWKVRVYSQGNYNTCLKHFSNIEGGLPNNIETISDGGDGDNFNYDCYLTGGDANFFGVYLMDSNATGEFEVVFEYEPSEFPYSAQEVNMIARGSTNFVYRNEDDSSDHLVTIWSSTCHDSAVDTVVEVYDMSTGEKIAYNDDRGGI